MVANIAFRARPFQSPAKTAAKIPSMTMAKNCPQHWMLLRAGRGIDSRDVGLTNPPTDPPNIH
jgi:hypothetical protein